MPSRASTPTTATAALTGVIVVWKRVSAVSGERDAVAEVGERADDGGADVAVLGQYDRVVDADGGGPRVGADGDRARARGQRHAAEVDAIDGDEHAVGCRGEAQAREGFGGRVGVGRHGGEQQRAGRGGAGGGAVERGRQRDGLVGHERERGGPVGGAPAVVHLGLDDRGEGEHDRGQRRDEAEHQHPTPGVRTALLALDARCVRCGRGSRPGGGEHAVTLGRAAAAPPPWSRTSPAPRLSTPPAPRHPHFAPRAHSAPRRRGASRRKAVRSRRPCAVRPPFGDGSGRAGPPPFRTPPRGARPPAG